VSASAAPRGARGGRESYFLRGDLWAVVGGLFSVGVAGAVRWAVGSAYNAF
jgi:hypothetical protein